MPLHLLGKKSWNVYNQDNIEKVRRDEAIAKAKEEAEEERMQEIDAERRIKILRGEEPAPLVIKETRANDGDNEKRIREPRQERKKRKRFGEDDTDFELRLASEQVKAADSETQIVLRKPNVDAPLTNRDGHIDLFPQEETKLSVSKNPEAEKEAARKAKEYEDQYTMRFSNAAGFKQGLENPWYSKKNDTSVETEVPSKDVWGNEDPRRKEREAKRMVSNDPLAFMKQGAAKVRQVEKERKQWRDERKTELEDLKRAEREERKRKRKHREEDELDGFRLDAPHKESRHGSDRKRSRHEDSRHSSRRERSPDRHRDRHRSRHEHGH